MAQSGHSDCRIGCPLLGVKRTSKVKSVTSAFDPTRTSAAQFSARHAAQFADIAFR
jgi:hypothetical protein